MLVLPRSFRYQKLDGFCHSGGGQGQVPQTPLLDEILGLRRDDGEVHQMSGWMTISHVDVG